MGDGELGCWISMLPPEVGNDLGIVSMNEPESQRPRLPRQPGEWPAPKIVPELFSKFPSPKPLCRGFSIQQFHTRNIVIQEKGVVP